MIDDPDLKRKNEKLKWQKPSELVMGTRIGGLMGGMRMMTRKTHKVLNLASDDAFLFFLFISYMLSVFSAAP